MAVQVQKRLFTVADYHKMGEVGILPEQGVELINGEIIQMNPIGSRHAKIVKKLNRILGKLLGDEAIISIQDPIIANDLSEPEPDVAILKYRADFYEHELPNGSDVLLIIEVADTTLTYDSQVKLPVYASSGVPEYWIIDLNTPAIQVYWQAEGDAYLFNEIYPLKSIVAAKTFQLSFSVSEIFQ